MSFFIIAGNYALSLIKLIFNNRDDFFLFFYLIRRDLRPAVRSQRNYLQLQTDVLFELQLPPRAQLHAEPAAHSFSQLCCRDANGQRCPAVRSGLKQEKATYDTICGIWSLDLKRPVQISIFLSISVGLWPGTLNRGLDSV